MSNKIKVKYRKLGRDKVWGWAHLADNTIELDERLKGKKHLEILIHEILHCQNPTWSESEVERKSKDMCAVLWDQHYRRIQI